MRIGISALKIEGRYKDADYVALTTRAYRKAVDEAWAGARAGCRSRRKAELEQVYSRGLGPFFLTGTNHQAVVQGRAPRHRGVRVGRVTRVSPRRCRGESGIRSRHPAAEARRRRGLRCGRLAQSAGAGRRRAHLPGAARGRRNLELAFGNGAMNAARIRPGDLVWRTHDPEIDKAARPYTAAAAPVRKQTVDVRVVAREGEPLELEWTLPAQPDVRVHVVSDAPLATAQNRGLTAEFLREQLGRLGNTPYELGKWSSNARVRRSRPARC